MFRQNPAAFIFAAEYHIQYSTSLKTLSGILEEAYRLANFHMEYNGEFFGILPSPKIAIDYTEE